MMAAVARSLEERTGRSLDDWVALVHASDRDPLDQNAVRRWLKSVHGMAPNSQWAVAAAAPRAAGWVPPSREAYIDSQYAGVKSALRPRFDALRLVIEGLGDDVVTQGRSTYIPFVRARQFVAVAAATRVRLDVGLRFTDAPDSPLLHPAATPGQATHRVSLSVDVDMTPAIVALLRTAYDQNG